MAPIRLSKEEKRRRRMAEYLSRDDAMNQLCMTAPEFRRACILKGVYPREPKSSAGADRNKIYYHTKDIEHLKRDPLMRTFRKIETHKRRVKNKLARGENMDAKVMMRRTPTYTLHHLLLERYPTFADALRDLDDAMCTVALYASLHADEKLGVKAEAIRSSASAIEEFHSWVVQKGALIRCFISIKGYYFQASVRGQRVLWLVPHQFAQDLPEEIDWGIMNTHLELYKTLVTFATFKLYLMSGISYPPEKRNDLAKLGLGFLALRLRSLTSSDEAAMDIDEQAATTAGFQRIASDKEDDLHTRTFQDCVFFVFREVALAPASLVLLSGGASGLGWQDEGSPFNDAFEGITHFVVDRPSSYLEGIALRHPGRDFVQPQWIFDSFNSRVLLPTGPYKPGATLPPHLSPFVDDLKKGYVPKQRLELEAAIRELAPERVGGGTRPSSQGVAALTDADHASDAEDEAAEVVGDAFRRFAAEIEAEAEASAELQGVEEKLKESKERQGIRAKLRAKYRSEHPKALMKYRERRLYNLMMHEVNKRDKYSKRLKKRHTAQEKRAEWRRQKDLASAAMADV